MYKKIIFGGLLTLVGLAFSLACFLFAAAHPWDWNGTGGLMGSFLGTSTLFPFLLGVVALIAGLVICFCEAYLKK